MKLLSFKHIPSVVSDIYATVEYTEIYLTSCDELLGILDYTGIHFNEGYIISREMITEIYEYLNS